MSQDNSKTKTIIEAAQLLQGALHKVLAAADGLHAETLVAAAARMAGTMLFRSFPDEANALDAGSVMISDAANRQGPQLMQVMFNTLRQLDHTQLDEHNLGGARATTGLARLSLAQTQQMLEPWYRKAKDVYGLSFAEMADAAAIATALVVHDCRTVLDIDTACSIAVHGLVESVKTVPAVYEQAAAAE